MASINRSDFRLQMSENQVWIAEIGDTLLGQTLDHRHILLVLSSVLSSRKNQQLIGGLA